MLVRNNKLLIRFATFRVGCDAVDPGPDHGPAQPPGEPHRVCRARLPFPFDWDNGAAERRLKTVPPDELTR